MAVLFVDGKDEKAEHSLSFPGGEPATLGKDKRYTLNIRQMYRVVKREDERGPWKVQTTGYFYALTGEDGATILEYHWHPAGSSPVVVPHLHLEKGAGNLRDDLHRAHIPTGRIAIEDAIRLAIEAFEVEPLRDDWDAVLKSSQDSFERWRTWGGSGPR